MATLLLVHPRLSFPGFHSEYPIGISCVAAYCRARGHEVVCVNACLSDDSLETLIEQQVKTRRFDAICTGGMTVFYAQIKEVVDAARSVAPHIKTVVGGPFVTSDPELAMTMVPCDYGVIGEGEFTLVELAEALTRDGDVSQVKGLIYRNRASGNGHGPFTRTEERPFIRDLDSMPPVDYDDFEYGRWIENLYPNSDRFVYSIVSHPRIANIVTSRSCPYSCTFCYHPLGKKYRQRSLDRVFEEIDLLVRKYRVNVINVMDELFSVNKAKILEFCARIKPYGLHWFCQVRVPDVDDEVLTAFKDSGGYLVSYGIESVSAPVLKSMKKRITREQIEKALSLTRQKGLGIQANLIFGDVEETRETAEESLEWWKKHIDYGLYLLMILAVPDSEIYRTCRARGIIQDRKKFIADRFPVLNFSKMDDPSFDSLRDFVTRVSISQPDYLNAGNLVRTETCETHGTCTTTVTFQCPECRKETTLENLRQFTNQPYMRLLCSHCRLVVSLPTRKVFATRYRLRPGNISRSLIANFVLLCYRSDRLYRTFVSSNNKGRIYNVARRLKQAIRS